MKEKFSSLIFEEIEITDLSEIKCKNFVFIEMDEIVEEIKNYNENQVTIIHQNESKSKTNESINVKNQIHVKDENNSFFKTLKDIPKNESFTRKVVEISTNPHHPKIIYQLKKEKKENRNIFYISNILDFVVERIDYLFSNFHFVKRNKNTSEKICKNVAFENTVRNFVGENIFCDLKEDFTYLIEKLSPLIQIESEFKMICYFFSVFSMIEVSNCIYEENEEKVDFKRKILKLYRFLSSKSYACCKENKLRFEHEKNGEFYENIKEMFILRFENELFEFKSVVFRNLFFYNYLFNNYFSEENKNETSYFFDEKIENFEEFLLFISYSQPPKIKKEIFCEIIFQKLGIIYLLELKKHRYEIIKNIYHFNETLVRDQFSKHNFFHLICKNENISSKILNFVFNNNICDPNLRDQDGFTPLMYLCQNINIKSKHLNIFLNQNKTIIPYGWTDKKGKNVLHYLCENENITKDILVSISKKLKQNEIEQLDNMGKTPLYYLSNNKKSSLKKIEIFNQKIEYNLYEEFYFLGFGVNNYISNSISSLRGPINDLEIISKLFYQMGYECDKINNATKNEMEKKIYESILKLKNSSKRKIFVFYYSGHGYMRTIEQKEKNFLCPSDFDSNNWTNTSIEIETIIDQFSKINFCHCVLILDCCFSGGIFKERGLYKKYPLLVNSNLSSVWAITAGGSELVKEKQSNNGKFFMNE